MNRSRLSAPLSCAAALLLLVLLPAQTSRAQEEEDRYKWEMVGFTVEYTMRHRTIVAPLPVYPEEMVKENLFAVVEVRLGVDEEGVVQKVKVPPGLNPLFRKAAVAAAKQWKFTPNAPSVRSQRRGDITTFRLTFRFYVAGGVGRSELYDPPEGTKGAERIREGFTSKIEWERWEDATDDDESTDAPSPSPSPPPA